MGYCIRMTKSTISISKENSIKMMDMLSKYIEDNKPDWMWIDIESLNEHCKSHDFEEVMYDLRYNVVFYEGDEIYKIDYFSGEKFGDEYEIFPMLAPYINNGYIQMLGDDGNRWRWVFKDGKFDEKQPTISWD